MPRLVSGRAVVLVVLLAGAALFYASLPAKAPEAPNARPMVVSNLAPERAYGLPDGSQQHREQRQAEANKALDVVLEQLDQQREALRREQEELARIQAQRAQEEQKLAQAQADVEAERKARLLAEQAQAPGEKQQAQEQEQEQQQQHQQPEEQHVAKALSQEEEKAKEDASFKAFWFNEYRSSQLPLNRSIPDTRIDECKSLKWDIKAMPVMSVIICFVDEAWSVVNRTPARLVGEIVLVDDGSTAEWLGPHLQAYIDKHWPKLVRVVRSDTRLGLIRARLLGARNAKGPVLTFLDSHCECNLQWAEPILDVIGKDRTAVVTPVIDTIEAKTMEHLPWVQRIPAVGTFSWTLDFTWKSGELKPGQKLTDAFDSPTMAGGLFSIDKSYFEEIGTYDEAMDGWGGENLEISFRIWQCGGKLVSHPCSHVGHIFRDSHPYSVPGGTIHDTFTKNSIRLAETWMDEYKEFFYQVRPNARGFPYGDISARVALREKLKCKPFKWFMENLVPKMFIPDAEHIVKSGALKNTDGQCLDKMGQNQGGKAGVYFCHGQGSNQAFMLTVNDEIRTTDDLCLDAWGQVPCDAHLQHCHGGRGNQAWQYFPDTGLVKHKGLAPMKTKKKRRRKRK